jgi:CRISPR/Cas system endoribonuclease Cas6 (RAMP superfamily)
MPLGIRPENIFLRLGSLWARIEDGRIARVAAITQITFMLHRLSHPIAWVLGGWQANGIAGNIASTSG